MSWLQVTNNAESTLNGAIDNDDTSMVVTSATPFPTTTPFRLTLEDEIVEVTVVAGTTFTITRGVEGTTGAAHADGTPVYLNILASHIQEIQAAFIFGAKVKAETRNSATASGDVSYTGYGFTPSGLIIFASGLTLNGLGSSNPAKAMFNLFQSYSVSGHMNIVTDTIVWCGVNVDNFTYASLKSYDADGFTLTWTRVVSPTGTINMTVFAIK